MTVKKVHAIMEEYAKMELLRTHAFVLWDLLDLTVRQVSNSIYILDNLKLFIRVKRHDGFYWLF